MEDHVAGQPRAASGSWHPAMRPDSELDQASNSSHPSHHEDVIGGVLAPIEPENALSPWIVEAAGPSRKGSQWKEQSKESPSEDEILITRDGDSFQPSNGREVFANDMNNVGKVASAQTSTEETDLKDERISKGESADQSQDAGMTSEGTGLEGFPDIVENTKTPSTAWKTRNEDDDMDYASIFQRKHSFPQVPSLQDLVMSPPQALPKSQVEDIMADETRDLDLPREDSVTLALDSQSRLASLTSGEAPFEDDSDFFDNVRDLRAVPSDRPFVDEEARFEEGLPLMSSQSMEATDLADERESIPMLSTNSHDVQQKYQIEVGEPREIVNESNTSNPLNLERKSTDQVLSSMELSQEVVGQIKSQNAIEEPTQWKSTMDDITAPQLSNDHQTLAEEQNVVTEKSNDADLAEMWKAALGDDELLEEDENPLDPSSFFGDDGDGFLEEEPEQGVADRSRTTTLSQNAQYDDLNGALSGPTKVDPRENKVENKYMPSQGAAQSIQSRIPMSRTLESSKVQSHTMIPRPTLNGSEPVDMASFQPTDSRPTMPRPAQSFADKSKGGYTSPYDLPMDISRPKKRSSIQQTGQMQGVQETIGRPPPPRSSSMFTGALPRLDSQPPVPPIPTSSNATSKTNNQVNLLKTKSSASSFFEELPATKSRPATSIGRYTSPTLHSPLSSQPPLPPPTIKPSAEPQHYQPSSTNPPFELLPPERLSLFNTTTPQQNTNQISPLANTRYSPAPNQTSTTAPPRNRYAPSPVGSGQPAQILPFQPRTSSPLAQSSSRIRQSSATADQFGQPVVHTADAQQYSAPPRTNVPRVPPTPHSEQFTASNEIQASSPMANPRSAPLSDSPSSSSRVIRTPETDRLSSDGPVGIQNTYEPSAQAFASPHRAPPKRSQTQSPSATRSIQGPSLDKPFASQRPASVNDEVPFAGAYNDIPPQQVRQQRRGLSQIANYIKPSDGRETDPLERWRGCPISAFGFGGTFVTTFPKHTPRYAAGQREPTIKCSPGEIKIQSVKAFALEEKIASFPGPLRSKSKKKEVLEWLQQNIVLLETSPTIGNESGHLPNQEKCRDERILLWKIIRVIVDNDGSIEGKETENSVRSILSPELNPGVTTLALESTSNLPAGILQRKNRGNALDHNSQDTMEEIRKCLLQGDREKAVWKAVDNRMWAHAMLLSSSLDAKIWKQVSSEFVRQEVKGFGDNTESMAAMYQILAGNGDESMDELVPPSARAGLQLVSKEASAGPTKNALDGLDRWRETLTLILGNRTQDDGKALVSLGQLLADYGRIEAAHICFLFAKTPGLFSGPDESQGSVALLGTDHVRRPFDCGRDFDSILLTEVFDFARTILTSSSVATISAHLQGYKLHHAIILADYGFKSEAQQYCDAISSALKSTTKLSTYYHPLLFGVLDNLSERLRQAPRDGSGSWISKPSIDKVSGSIWAKFNSYVAGDESDAASTGSGLAHEADSGPFSRIVGDSPTLSRTASSGDLYSQSAGLGLAQAQVNLPAAMNTRYAPAGLSTPRSSLEQQRRPSQESPRPALAETLRFAYPSQAFSSRPTSSAGTNARSYKAQTQTQPMSYPSHSGSYLPTPPSQPEHLPEDPARASPLSLNPGNDHHRPTAPTETGTRLLHPYEAASYMASGEHGHSTYDPNSYSPSSKLGQESRGPEHENVQAEPGYSSYDTLSASDDVPSNITGYEPPSSSAYGPPGDNSYEPPSNGGYEPPSSSGYEPPSSSGYEPPSSSGYEPPSSSGYEPPGSSGYEPPSYSPPSYNPDFPQDQDASTQEKVGRSLTNNDEDDGFEARAAAIRREEKARKDREADEAFRRAAEEDSKKDDAQELKSKKSGWFGGNSWFGGAKDKAKAEPPNQPIKVNLGEENSFFFDKEKGKWVNKKADPAEQEKAHAPPPPPPKGPPSRAVSGAGPGPPRAASGTPPVPPLPTSLPTPPNSALATTKTTPPSFHLPNQASRAATPVVDSGRPLSSAFAALDGDALSTGPPSGPPSAPPSRPATGQSGAMGIDDLLGAPQARKGGTLKKAKKGRGYVDVMAK